MGQPQAVVVQQQEQFYTSLALLSRHYGIAPADTRSLCFPYGQQLALHEVQRLLKERNSTGVEVAFELSETETWALHVNETFNTRNTLYYIPIAPLYRLLRDKRRKKLGQLLLSVCAYLYQHAGVAYYGEEYSYLYWNYETLTDWLTDNPEDWETDYYNVCRNEINNATHIGTVMLRRLASPKPLACFERWISECVTGDRFERQCLSLAKNAFALKTQYPDAHIFTHADTDCLPDPDSDVYDDNDCITMYKYISFCAETKGELYRQLEDSINSEFGECVTQQKPFLRRCFDGRVQQTDSLDYEDRLFTLLDELCYLLNTIDDEPE